MKTPIKSILSICLLGSSLFAGSFSFAETIFPQQAPKQDLSVFVERLATRLQGVLGEIVNLTTGKTTINDSLLSSGSVDTGLLATMYLTDVVGHMHEDDIRYLVDEGVVDSYREKFYPDNYLRRYEMAIMYVKYQFAKNGQEFPQITFPTLGWFGDVAQNSSYAPYVAYADQQHRFNDFVGKNNLGQKQFKPNAFVTIEEILRLMNLPVMSGDQLKIKRGEFAHLLVRGTREGLFVVESPLDAGVDMDAIPDADSPILDGNQVLNTLKTLFAMK